jgi:SAM-dependent methyltransferase
LVIHRAWDWTKERSERWLVPSEDSYYLLHRWKELKFQRFLDFGCGRGRHAIFFANNGFDVSAMDLSSISVKELSEYAKQENLNIKCDVADMTDLPYQDDSFDCLIAYHVISHSNRAGVAKALSEIHRVVKKSGEVFVTFCSSKTLESIPNHWEVIEPNVIDKHEAGPEEGILHFYPDAEDLLMLLKDFEILQTRHSQNVDLTSGIWRGFHFFVNLKVVK